MQYGQSKVTEIQDNQKNYFEEIFSIRVLHSASDLPIIKYLLRSMVLVQNAIVFSCM